MRLIATVETYNLEFSSLYSRPIHARCKSKLTIGKKRPQDSHPIVVISSNNNKNGNNYQINENIARIFCTRSNQGMATIRFKSPNHDVLISKADPIQLKAFLNVLTTSSKTVNTNNNSNNNNNVNFSLLTPFSNKEVSKTKLVISNRRDYPITTNFPFSLAHLSINNIKMSKMDLRIFKLKRLKELDLSHNNLKEIPEEGWDELTSLIDLNLSSNQLVRLPEGLCCSRVAGGLRKLNVSCNKMASVPWQIGNFGSLGELHLKGNLISRLPESLTRLKQLKTLDVSNNEISFLPGGFLYMRLHSVDLTFQRRTLDNSLAPLTLHHFPASLYELSARCVVDNKLTYTETDTQTQAYIHAHKVCSSCRRACFERLVTSARYINLNSIAEVVLRGEDIPVMLVACSIRCYERMKRR